jgi:hypothetical protein
MVPGSRRKLVEERLAALASGFSRYVDAYDDLVPFTSQQLRLHRQTIALRREAGSAGQAIDSTDFLLSLRATLEAWGLGVRGSRLAPEGEFVTAIRSARAHIEALDGLLVDDPSLISNVGEQIFSMLGSLNVVDNQAKLVAGTKTLHHLLPDLVMPMDRVWTGRFFQLHSPEWQAQDNQRRTFLRVFGDLRAIARLTHPHQYADGLGWRTSRSKILDNALIGFCKVELSDQAIEYGTDARRGLVFTVPGFPPAKNEALSMLGVGHSHSSRVLSLLQAAKEALERSGFAPIDGRPVALEVTVNTPQDRDPWDATNYLGGIADVLEDKSKRGNLVHLGELRHTWVYRNDRQIKQVSYRQLESADASYTVRIRELSTTPEN